MVRFLIRRVVLTGAIGGFLAGAVKIRVGRSFTTTNA